MRNFDIHFVPSQFRRLICIILYILLTINSILYFEGGWRALISLMLFLTLLWAWRETPNHIIKIHVDVYGRVYLYCHANNKPQMAILEAGSFIHLYGCFLKWRMQNGQIVWQTVFPDSTNTHDFRKLRVWAHFGQNSKIV